MLLFYSSFIFLGNAAAAFFKKFYLYAAAFLGMTATSLVFHWDPTPTKTRIDQMLVGAVILCGGRVFYSKWPVKKRISAVVLGTFLLTGYLYTYGFFTQQYCFHPEKVVSDRFHFLLHLIASFGHYWITFM